MTAKEYLNQVRKLDNLIDSKLSEVNNLKRAATSITAALKDVPARSEGTTSDKVGNSVAAIVDLEKEIDEEVAQLVELRGEILKTIQLLDPMEYALIYKRYFQYKRWEVIADEMYYTRQWINALHKRALENLEKILENL